MGIFFKKKQPFTLGGPWGKGPAEQSGQQTQAQPQLLSADGLLAKVSP